MRWDDRTFSGRHGDYDWFVSREWIEDLAALILREHVGLRLWITTFDGGSITPNEEELDVGWEVVGNIMVSPPMTPDLEIPQNHDNEWYIFEDLNPRTFCDERFVSYGGFNLADPQEMAASFDPSWERDGLDYLYPIQERFWTQIGKLLPFTYIGIGDNDVVVTRHRQFADLIRARV